MAVPNTRCIEFRAVLTRNVLCMCALMALRAASSSEQFDPRRAVHVCRWRYALHRVPSSLTRAAQCMCADGVTRCIEFRAVLTRTAQSMCADGVARCVEFRAVLTRAALCMRALMVLRARRVSSSLTTGTMSDNGRRSHTSSAEVIVVVRKLEATPLCGRRWNLHIFQQLE
jgi:hypothetical protein